MPDSSADHRRSLRTRRLRKARCVFNNGASSLDVTLRDLSASGARVVGDGLAFLPPTFELRILEGDGVGVHSARRARLAWTDGRTAGLEFIT
jgi:PilZ domain